MENQDKEDTESQISENALKESTWTEVEIKEASENYKLLELTKIQVKTGNWDLTDSFDVPNPYK
jgi:hypothetical protein